LNNGYQIGIRPNYTQRDNIVLPVPFYHCFGMVMGSLAALTRGAGITLVCEGFDPQKSLEAASKYKSTSLYGVPTMFL
jgi:fatty-acyl-CoA synthase